MRAPLPYASRQRGVALIMAVLIVALATILATQIGFEGALEQRRSIAVLNLDQAFQVGLGAEAWAAFYLKQDFEEHPQQDHPAERWATPIPPIPIDDGQIEGQIEDLQGRFNLNSLVTRDGKINPEGLRRFRNLLNELDLEAKWADLLADWLDADTQPSSNGAEDNIYLSQTPPYRTANGPITSSSELLALPGFDAELYRRIRPYVTALPIGTKLNLCTAPGVVIDAYNDGTLEYGLNPESLARSREQRCFPTKNEIQGAFAADIYQKVQDEIGETSGYFELKTIVTIGSTEFSLYSLLQRDRTGLSRPVLRSFGTD